MPKKTLTVIPRHEPETVRAVAHNVYRGDEEKVATTAIKTLRVGGVNVTSRYGKDYELTEMAKMLERIDGELRERIWSMDCDSKACLRYRVEVVTEAEIFASQIGKALDLATEGHNGISFIDHRGDLIWEVDPKWPEDWLSPTA